MPPPMEVHMLQQPTTDQPSTIDQPSTRRAAHRAPRRIRLAVVVITASAFLASAGLAMANDGGFAPGDLGAAFGFGGPGVVRGGIGRQIAITGISGNDLALKTTDGWTRTITVSSSTTITKAGQTITVGDLDRRGHHPFQPDRSFGRDLHHRRHRRRRAHRRRPGHGQGSPTRSPSPVVTGRPRPSTSPPPRPTRS